MSMRRWLSAGVAAAAVFTGACSSTFLVSKDGRGYFIGNDSKAVYKMLCESGDLGKILSDTQLPQDMRGNLYKYNCSPERSGEKVKEIYASMTPGQRKDLRMAFRHNGYDINYLPC